MAAQHFAREGFVVVQKNFYTRYGELDLIVQKGKLLVVVEVKWRRNASFGCAADGITHTKQQRMRRAAARYLQTHPHAGPVRMDALLIDGTPPSLHITHLRGIG